MQRFYDKIMPVEDGCHLWTAAVDRLGYGRFRMGRVHVGAHRVGYEIVKGPIPINLELDHLCRVRSCVNPDHLEPVTHQENMRRAISFIKKRTHCVNGHELSDGNVRITKSGLQTGIKRCGICRLEQSRIHNSTRRRR